MAHNYIHLPAIMRQIEKETWRASVAKQIGFGKVTFIECVNCDDEASIDSATHEQFDGGLDAIGWVEYTATPEGETYLCKKCADYMLETSNR